MSEKSAWHFFFLNSFGWGVEAKRVLQESVLRYVFVQHFSVAHWDNGCFSLCRETMTLIQSYVKENTVKKSARRRWFTILGKLMKPPTCIWGYERLWPKTLCLKETRVQQRDFSLALRYILSYLQGQRVEIKVKLNMHYYST